MSAARAGEAAYPTDGEADVVLADGGTVHLRPIVAADAARLVALHSRLSEQTVYYRFFSPKKELSPKAVKNFTEVDGLDRGALVAVLGPDMVGVARWDRQPGTDSAEVAFVVEDAHQGRGLGSTLLEHLAAAARERGVATFTADVLPENRRMVRVFLDAGYVATRSYDSGTVHLRFPIAPTQTSVEVMRAREHCAEARSIARLLAPRSVAVVGASRRPDSVGYRMLVNLLDGGFAGPVYAVNPAAAGGLVAGVSAHASVADLPSPVDLAVLAVPPAAVSAVVGQCVTAGVRGLVVVTDLGPAAPAAERELVRAARAGGMRVIGPNCLGVANTDPAVDLNATLAPVLPARGSVGFFSQSGALGIALLAAAARRNLGLSTFVSAGRRADVSGNDLLQYWEDDPATSVVLLYLETFGNPRKFARLARRLSRSKPVVAVRRDRSPALDAVLREAGVVRVDTVAHMFDAAAVLAAQPLPAGDAVGVVANSDALALLAQNACTSEGLRLVRTAELATTSSAQAYSGALADVLADPAVDAVVALFVTPLGATPRQLADALAATAGTGKPVVATLLGAEGLREELSGVPSYPSPEDAVTALAHAVRYAGWRRRPPGRLPDLPGVDAAAARALVAGRTGALPAASVAGLLAAYGLVLWPAVPVRSRADALAAADRLGWPVALKVTAPELRHRVDLGGVRLDLGSAPDLGAAFAGLRERLGETAELVVQRMAPHGVAVVVSSSEDAALGPVVSFGVGGVATELLGDRAFRAAPLTDLDAAGIVREVRAAPLLTGHRGAAPVALAALEDLVLRVGRLADELPEVVRLVLNPVVVGEDGLAVLGAEVTVGPPPRDSETGPRRLR